MDQIKKREVLVGIVMLGAGLFYLLLTMNLPRRGVVDAAFVPYGLALIMCGLGIMQLLAGCALKPAEPAARETGGDGETEDAPGFGDYPTVLKTLALIIGFTALLNPVGFPIVTAVYLFLQFLVLTPADTKASYPLYAVIAVVSSAVIFVTFRYGFDLLLPAGLLAGIIG